MSQKETSPTAQERISTFMNHSKIGTLEAIFLIITVIIIHTILSLPKTLLDNTKSATILNIIYITILVLIFIYIICRLLKKFPGMDLLDISEVLGGKFFKNIIGCIFIIYFVVTSSILLRNFCECLKIINYPFTNIFFIILFVVIAISTVNRLQFNAGFKTNLIIIPFVLFSILFLFFANLRYFTPQRIFPIFGEGVIQTFAVGLQNISAFGGIVFLYFLPPLLKEPEKFKKIALTSVLISAIYLVLAISILLFMFVAFQNVDEIMPLYSAAAYIEFGTFFQRLDSLFLLIWTLSFACYLCIVSKFAIHIFRKLTNIKEIKPIIYPLAFIMIGIALIPKNYAISKFYETSIYPWLVIGLVFLLSFSILILAYIKQRKKVGVANE